jgi:LysM repeat protein
MLIQPSLHRRLLLGLALLILLFPSLPVSVQALPRAWGTRPLLSYFALTASLQAPLRLGARLSPAQFALVRRIADGEQAQLRRLLQESQNITSDATLSLEQKRLSIQGIGYNRRVDAIVYASERALVSALEPAAYARLVAWIEARWPIEQRLHGVQAVAVLPGWDARSWLERLFPALAPLEAPLRAPRTFEIFATRYDAKGRYTAALPDQCLKLTNGGLHTCDDKGYVVGQRYEIFMSYKGPATNAGSKKGVGVVVAEAGPWNIDDNFWATLADPTPRRMFADLGLGMPEAQAAFYNGYNGGLDQYGRKVTAPFAIDLAFEVADDLGLPLQTNDWINVSFLWTDGWGSGSASGSGEGQPGSAPPAAISPVETAAYKPDGSQVHTVQAGQTLWTIAMAYGVTIQRLRDLNGLPAPSATGESDVILPGQKLLVRSAGATTATEAGDSTDTPAVDARPIPTARRTTTSTPVPAALTAGIVTPKIGEATPVALIVEPGGEPAASTDLTTGSKSSLLLIILGLVAIGAILYLLGSWLSGRK